MAKVRKTELRLPLSQSADVVAYKMYVAEAAADVQAVDVDGNFVAPVYNLPMDTIENNELVVDLSLIADLGTKDNVFNLGFTSVDDAGNESGMTVVNGVSLDFTAPDAPGEPRIIRF